jgi:hypothetical protein
MTQATSPHCCTPACGTALAVPSGSGSGSVAVAVWQWQCGSGSGSVAVWQCGSVAVDGWQLVSDVSWVM